MIIKSNKIPESKFEIKVNNEIKYFAGMSTLHNNYRSCQMFNADGSICYVTSRNSKSIYRRS